MLDWHTHKVRKLTNEQAKDRGWEFVAWSPDGRSIYANRGAVGGMDADIYRIDFKTGKLENLTPHQGQTVYAASSVSSDGRTLLISSNKTGFNNVALLDIGSKQIKAVTETQWDAEPGKFAPSGGAIYLSHQSRWPDADLSWQREGGAPKPLPFPKGLTYFGGNGTPFSPGGDRLLIGHQSSQRPSDLWIYDLHSGRRRS